MGAAVGANVAGRVERAVVLPPSRTTIVIAAIFYLNRALAVHAHKRTLLSRTGGAGDAVLTLKFDVRVVRASDLGIVQQVWQTAFC